MVDDYKNFKKLVKSQIKILVRQYEYSIASKAKENPKLVYEYFNSKKQIKSDIRALTYSLGKRREDPKDIVEILNKQFKSVIEKDDGHGHWLYFGKNNRENVYTMKLGRGRMKYTH